MASLKYRTPAVRIVQVTDPHLGETSDFSLAGVNTLQSFNAVMAEVVLSSPRPEMIAVTGDIAADADPKAYKQFSRSFSTLEIPFAWLPGNHDRFEVMQEHIDTQPFEQLKEIAGWRLLFLVSAVDDQVGGTLAEEQLDNVRSAINADDDRPIALFMHHPPSEVGSAWLDKQRISNEAELSNLLSGSQKVKAIFAGHVHQANAVKWAGVDVYTAPSTCVQFAPNSDEFLLSQQPPGFRWIDLYEDGHLETGVNYITTDSQQVDKTVVGY